MDDVISLSRLGRREEATNGTRPRGGEESERKERASEREKERGRERGRERRRKQKESIVTTRLDFMNIIFQQMSWTIGRRRRRRRRN